MENAVRLIKHYTNNNVTISSTVEEHVNVIKNWIETIVTVPLGNNQLNALVSLVSDIGAGEFTNSQLLAYLNKGNITMAANEFLSLAKDGRVMSIKKVKRRRDEKDLFLQGDI
jgi:lysozyme